MPVRSMDKMTAGIKSAHEIGKASAIFTGSTDATSPEVFVECAHMLIEHYSELAISEIREAFTLAATGAIECSLTSYRGVFTVAMFGGILNAYRKYRREIVAKIENAKKQEEEERAEYEAKLKNRHFRENVISSFKALCEVNNAFETVDQIPFIWAKILREAGLLDKSNELWVEAKREACIEFLTAVSNREPYLGVSESKRIGLAAEMNKDKDFFPEELRQRAEVVYSKLLVFSKIAKFNKHGTSTH